MLTAIDDIQGGREVALMIGIAGTLAAGSDIADFPLCVPFPMTLRRMKTMLKSGATGAMTVQLRRSTTMNPPSYSNVSGFLATYASGQTAIQVDPTDVDVNENDCLNLSIATPSGTNLLVEIIGIAR